MQSKSKSVSPLCVVHPRICIRWSGCWFLAETWPNWLLTPAALALLGLLFPKVLMTWAETVLHFVLLSFNAKSVWFTRGYSWPCWSYVSSGLGQMFGVFDDGLSSAVFHATLSWAVFDEAFSWAVSWAVFHDNRSSSSFDDSPSPKRTLRSHFSELVRFSSKMPGWACPCPVRRSRRRICELGIDGEKLWMK